VCVHMHREMQSHAHSQTYDSNSPPSDQTYLPYPCFLSWCQFPLYWSPCQWGNRNASQEEIQRRHVLSNLSSRTDSQPLCTMH
jgi:hypothetical protein